MTHRTADVVGGASGIGTLGLITELPAVVFLCKSPWLTGAVLDLNGGAHMMRYPDLMGHVRKLAAQ
jgi:hypothetical protein